MRLWIILYCASASVVSAATDADLRGRFDASVRAQKDGDLAGAAAGYREVLAGNPKLTVARHLLGVCELQLGHVEEGIRQLETVRRDHPENRQAAYTLVSTYIAVGRLDEASRIVDTTLRGDATAPGHFMRGAYAMARGDYALAIRELEQARKLDHSLLGVTSHLGVAYCFANRLDEAVPVLEAALRENSADANAAAFLGWLYKDRDRSEEAAALLENTVRARPEDKGALFLLAQLTQSRGEPVQAATLLEKVVSLDPAYRPAHVLLARLYQQLKRYEDANREKSIIERLNAEQQAAQPGAR